MRKDDNEARKRRTDASANPARDSAMSARETSRSETAASAALPKSGESAGQVQRRRHRFWLTLSAFARPTTRAGAPAPWIDRLVGPPARQSQPLASQPGLRVPRSDEGALANVRSAGFQLSEPSARRLLPNGQAAALSEPLDDVGALVAGNVGCQPRDPGSAPADRHRLRGDRFTFSRAATSTVVNSSGRRSLCSTGSTSQTGSQPTTTRTLSRRRSLLAPDRATSRTRGRENRAERPDSPRAQLRNAPTQRRRQLRVHRHRQRWAAMPSKDFTMRDHHATSSRTARHGTMSMEITIRIGSAGVITTRAGAAVVIA
jgi:hypothetical protein